MAFWALAGASALSGLGSYIAGNEAADASRDAARENSQTQRYMYDRSVELSEPWRQSGIGALNEMNALMGLAPVNAYSGGVGTPGSNNVGGYVGANPDLANAFNALSPSDQRGIATLGYDRNNDGQISQEEFGQFHYDTHGSGEGRTMPTFTTPTAEQTAQSQGDAYQRFLDGGFARSMLETTQADFDMMTDAAGAGGTALSGQYLEALNDRNRRNTNTAYTQHFNALGGMSGTGVNIAQSQGAQGMQLANSLSANNNQAANATGSSYLNAANALGGTLQNGVDTYMYGRGQGWWGS
ncbi:MAG: EF-hand domain-containing protein [Pseudomonadota bacterium]